MKPKQTYSSSTTMHGIPQNSHLGAAVRWEERKLRKSCNRSGGWRVAVCSNGERLKSSGRVNKTVQIVQTRARVSGSWHAYGRRGRIGTLLHYAFGLQAAGMDGSVMVGRGTRGAAVFILIVFILLLRASSSRAQKGTWSFTEVKVLVSW